MTRDEFMEYAKEAIDRAFDGKRNRMMNLVEQAWAEGKRNAEVTPFEVLERLSTAHYGKQMFFMQDNGLIYDRYEHDYITLDTAINRMAKILMLDEDRIC